MRETIWCRRLLCLVCVVVLAGLAPAHAFKAPQAKGRFSAVATGDPVLTVSVATLRLDEVKASDPLRAGWDAFRAAHGPGWAITLDKRSGAPMLVEGPGIPWIAGSGNNIKNAAPVTLASLAGSLKAFVAANQSLFLADTAELVLNRQGSGQLTPEIWQVVFDRVVDGVPVGGDRYVFTVGHGNLISFGAPRWTKITATSRPDLDSARGMRLLQQYMGLTPSDAAEFLDTGRLLYVPVHTTPPVDGKYTGAIGAGYESALVWRFVLRVQGDVGTWVGYVDAHSGAVRALFDDAQYGQVKGGVYPVTDDQIGPEGTEQPNYPMPFADLTINGTAAPAASSMGIFNCSPIGGTATTKLAGPYVKVGDVCGAVAESVTCDADPDLLYGAGADCTVPAGHSAGDTHSARTGFYHLNRWKEHAMYWLPGNTWLPTQLTDNVNVNNTCNAYWDGGGATGTVNFYRSGGGCRNTGEISAVFLHEVGHGIDQNDGGGYDNPSEAYSDITAELALHQSCIGRGFYADNSNCDGYGNACLNCSGIRDDDWAMRTNNTPSTAAGFISTCSSGAGPCGKEVHCESYLAAETIWDLAVRDLPASGLDLATAWQVVDRLWYVSRTGSGGNAYNCSGTTSDGCAATSWFSKMRAVDDDDGNLTNGTPHAAAIFAAFNRHGIACGLANDASNQSTSNCPALATPALSGAVGSASAVLTWAAVPNAAQYLILRNDNSCAQSFTVMATVPAPGTTHTDSNLVNGFTEYYRVQAVGANGACLSGLSNCEAVTPQPFVGSIALDAGVYNCHGLITVTVTDANIPGTTTTVDVWSTTEPTPQTITLTQTPGTAKYVGTIQATPDPPAADGLLSLADGATITARYIDADDGQGNSGVQHDATALADCASPLITNVASSDVTGQSARITWTTNEPANSGVRYGPTIPPASGAGSPALVTGHDVVVAGLNECAQYYFSVDSADVAGNVAADDNGGAFFAFTTGKNTSPTYTYPGPAVPIPDNNPTGGSAVINVPFFDYLASVTVTVNITHTYDGDIALSLIAPNGTVVPLATHRGSSGANYTNTTFDDAAATAISAGTAPFTGSFRPESPLSALAGAVSYGDWTLKVVDNLSSYSGTIDNWSLHLNFPPAPCGAQMLLDASVYNCASSTAITVKDGNVVGATVTVTAVSATEPAGETVVLTRQPAPRETWFQGSLQLAPPPALPANGQLSVVHGDTVAITYIDADDGQGNTNVPVTSTATTDCIGPVITNVAATNVTGNSAVIGWTTDQAATSVVHYGLTIPPSATSSSTALVTGHTKTLTGLSECAQYYYSVESVDAVGNGTVDDNGGAYFTFHTSKNVNPTYTYPGPAIPVPDNNPTGASASITVSDQNIVSDVNVLVNLTYTYDGDINISLVGPTGTTVALASRRGSSGQNFTNTVFDDQATTPISAGTAPFTGSFIPEQPLSVFNGTVPTGVWTLKVVDVLSGYSGTIDNWSLVLTYPPEPCGAKVWMDAAIYSCSSTVTITVKDGNVVGSTVAVTVASNTEVTPETVTLTRLAAPYDTWFQGTLPLASPPPVGGNGQLSVVDADTITATYIDVDDGQGNTNVPVTTTAATDCVVPAITNVAATSVTGNSAVIDWTTNEAATSTVHYGLTIPPAATSSLASLVTTHAQPLAGLSECALYYYSVESADAVGNVAVDNNGGAYRTFRTSRNVSPTYTYPGPAVPIPDNSPTGATATINVTDLNFVDDVNVLVNITHTYDGDLTLHLVGPDNTDVVLSDKRGLGGDNFTNTLFDDAATTPISSGAAPFTGSFKPDAPLSAFNGKLAQGAWKLLVVDSAAYDTGTIQNWSLVLTYPAEPCGAKLWTDAPTYSCSSTVTITVKDSNVVGSTVTVTAASTAETTPETVTLTRLAAPYDTSFQGTLPLAPPPPVLHNGQLSVVNNDTITVTYIDADDGQGNTNVPVTTTATTICAPPVITNVSSSNVTGNSANINWTTNNAATSVVHYGLTIPPALTASSATLVTAHALSLAGLTPCSTYYYSVQSVDVYGNGATDDNGGAYYTFTTGQNVTPTYTSTDTPLPIPDNNAAGATSTITVTDNKLVQGVKVTVNITHTWDSDISLSLIAPNGTTVPLATKRGSSGDNYTNTVFDDAATTPISAGTAPFTGSFRPETPLSVLNGISATGAWKLKVVDSLISYSGTIENWSLQLTYPPQTCGPHATYESRALVQDTCSSGGAGNNNGFPEAGEDETFSVTLRNDGTVPLTGVTATVVPVTPGVTMVHGTASYGDIAVDGVGTSLTPHFTAALPTSLTCGGAVAFNVVIHTSQGTYTAGPFSMVIGQVVPGGGTALSENFSGGIPANWTVVDGGTGGGTAATWTTANPGNRTFAPPMVAPAAIVDSDKAGSAATQDEQLITPVLNLSTTLTVQLDFDQYFNWYTYGLDEKGDVDVKSSLTGGAWVNVFRNQGADSPNPDHKTLNITAQAAGAADVQIRFHYYNGQYEMWWAIDNIVVTYTAPGACNMTVCIPLAPTGEPIQQVWVGTTEQQWEPIAGATSYNVYRGVAADLPKLLTTAADSCLRLNVPGTSTGAALTESPAPGELYWYLVRAANAGGEGPAGAGTAGPRVHNAPGSCP